MKEIDFERASALLDVMAKVANVGPMFTTLSGEAGEELKGILADCQSNARERADKIRQEEQVAQQQALQASTVIANEKQPDPNPPNIPSVGPGQPTITSPIKPTVEDTNANGIADVQERPTVMQPTTTIIDRKI